MNEFNHARRQPVHDPINAGWLNFGQIMIDCASPKRGDAPSQGPDTGHCAGTVKVGLGGDRRAETGHFAPLFWVLALWQRT